jgi:hypothetical protein
MNIPSEQIARRFPMIRLIHSNGTSPRRPSIKLPKQKQKKSHRMQNIAIFSKCPPTQVFNWQQAVPFNANQWLRDTVRITVGPFIRQRTYWQGVCPIRTKDICFLFPSKHFIQTQTLSGDWCT